MMKFEYKGSYWYTGELVFVKIDCREWEPRFLKYIDKTAQYPIAVTASIDGGHIFYSGDIKKYHNPAEDKVIYHNGNMFFIDSTSQEYEFSHNGEEWVDGILKVYSPPVNSFLSSDGKWYACIRDKPEEEELTIRVPINKKESVKQALKKLGVKII